jgi:solute:Na+ symporter, SSS family
LPPIFLLGKMASQPPNRTSLAIRFRGWYRRSDSVPSFLRGAIVPQFASTDSLVLLLYFFFVLSVGISLKPLLAGRLDFFEAGRALPAWVCGVAMAAASLGPLEIVGMSAAGAHYGFLSIPFYAIGAVLPIVFAALFLIPAYYSSNARTLPGFLALRFDNKARILHAALFAAMSLVSAGTSLYVMARVFAALHVFEEPLRASGLDARGAMILSMSLPAALVLAAILLGGLTGTIYNLAIQFFVNVAGLLPVVFLCLKKIGGWDGLTAAQNLSAFAQRSGSHLSIASIAAAIALGVVFSAGTWCADFRVLQSAFAAKDARAARRAPWIAAALRVLVPFVLILPAIVALGLPTPHTTIVIHNENGAIYHDITVVPPEIDAGQGLVPARIDATGKPLKDSAGRTLLDEAMAAPQVIVHFLPTGLLGLGIAALLASMMAGMGASLSAFATVFVCDLYEPLLRPHGQNDTSPGAAKPDRSVAVMRWAAVAGALLSLGFALLGMQFGDPSAMAVLVGAIVIAPLLATLLLGVFFKRTTASGAFCGLIAGAIAALIHHGLALPAGELRGIHGGWIVPLHHPSSNLGFDLGTALCAFVASLVVTAVVSALTKPRSDAQPIEVTPSSSMKLDARIPMGMFFTLTGTILAAFGLSTRTRPDFYAKSLGIDINLWWGIVLLSFGIAALTLGRRAQAQIEKAVNKQLKK